MGYRSLVKSNVKKAFKYIGDLAIDLVLYKSSSQSYDFTDAEPITSSVIVATIKGVLVSEVKDSVRSGVSNKEATVSTFLINRESVEDMSVFNDLDKIKSGTRSWSFESYNDNGYTITVTAVKEG
jgi:hypothetical protein